MFWELHVNGFRSAFLPSVWIRTLRAMCSVISKCWGKQDGVHPHGYKTDHPWFMVCKDEIEVCIWRALSRRPLPACSLQNLQGGVYECVQYTQRPGWKYAGLRRHVGRKLYPGGRRVWHLLPVWQWQGNRTEMSARKRVRRESAKLQRKIMTHESVTWKALLTLFIDFSHAK